MRLALRGPAWIPVRDQLLPDRDAVHPVRHRGDLPVPHRRAAAGVWHVRDDRDDRVRGPADDRARVRLAQRSPGMEVKREPLSDFRVRQLKASDMLRGDLEGEDLDRYAEQR